MSVNPFGPEFAPRRGTAHRCAYTSRGDNVTHYPNDKQRSDDNAVDDNDFRDIFALGRFFEGIRDLRRNGPGFSIQISARYLDGL